MQNKEAIAEIKAVDFYYIQHHFERRLNKHIEKWRVKSRIASGRWCISKYIWHRYTWENLHCVLEDVFNETNITFIFIIDEWDCIFRVHKNDSDSQKKYLDFLRNLLKDQSYVALAYMTGILPVKKHGEHSALNMFTEVSMTNARELSEFTGFTEPEVVELCKKYDMSIAETKRWYDGYNIRGISTYNPRSVVMSMTGHDYDNYWTSTETYEALKVYIQMNFDGLKDYSGEVLLIGISYDKDTKVHS